MPFPAVVTRDDIVGLIGAHWCLYIFHASDVFSVYLHSLKVVVFCFVPIGQVPKNANVLQAEVVPFVGIRVIWHLVIVNVLALSPNTGHLHKLTGVDLLGSASLVSILSWDPTTVHDDCRSINFNGVFLRKCILE